MKYQTHKNFLPPDFFKKISNLIMDNDFAWRRRDSMTINADDGMYFTYTFYSYFLPRSNLYEPYIIPILKKLQAEAPLIVRTNLFVSALFNKSKKKFWHRDYEFQCKTAILYLNDCDGGTELKINNEIKFIKAEANKMLVFDTLIYHRAITSKQAPLRYIINFNYFTK